MAKLSRLTKSEEERIRAMAAYIDNHLQEKLTIKVLGQLYWMSEKKINRGFRIVFGMNAHRYIMKTRMGMALFMISNSDKQIKLIARECGYKDVTAFGRIFKKFFGKSPAEYRSTL